MNIKNPKSSKGFTIVELMIALSVLSTILLISTVVLINIGALYTKGVNAAALQNATRNISSDITKAVEFSGAKPTPPLSDCTTTVYCAAGQLPPINLGSDTITIYSMCINTTRYSYVIGQESGLDGDPASGHSGIRMEHVLWRDTMNNSGSCTPLRIDQANVLGDNASVSGNGTTSDGYDMVPEHMRLTRFKVMENPVGSGIYNIETWLAYGDSDLVVTVPATGVSTCKGGAGTQYCGTAAVSTSVTRRLE